MTYDKEIKGLENEYSGERVFILGNGPSLTQTPIEMLGSEYTLGLTQIGKIYTDTDWRPSFYYNPLGPDHSLAPADLSIVVDNCESETICFLDSGWSDVTKSEANVFYFDKWSLFNSPLANATNSEIKQLPISYLYEFWSENIANIVYHYHSMYGAIQVAAFLGFDEMIFLGCDFGMEYSDPHMIFKSGLDPHRYDGNKYSYLKKSFRKKNMLQSLANGVAMKLIKKSYMSEFSKYLSVMFNNDRNDHFSKDYFDSIVIMDGERHEYQIRKSHIIAKRICEDNGIDMYNATPGGELEVYDRVELNSLVNW